MSNIFDDFFEIFLLLKQTSLTSQINNLILDTKIECERYLNHIRPRSIVDYVESKPITFLHVEESVDLLNISSDEENDRSNSTDSPLPNSESPTPPKLEIAISDNLEKIAIRKPIR